MEIKLEFVMNYSIALLSDMRIPHNHSFLNGVLWQELALSNNLIEVGITGKGFIPFIKSVNSGQFVFGSQKNGVQGRIINYFLFIINFVSVFRILLKSKVNVIYVRNDPIFCFFAFIYRFLSFNNNVLVVYQLSHLKEEQLLSSKTNSKDYSFIKGLGARLNRLLRDVTVNKSDVNFFISNSMKEYMVKLNGNVIEKKSFVFGLGMSTRWDVDKFDIDSSYSIYVGTLDSCRGMDVTIKAYIDAFNEGLVNIPLFIIGGDKNYKDKECLTQIVFRLKANDIIKFIPTCDRLDCYSYIKGAKFAICTFPDSMINRTISPTKLFEYLYFKVPTLCSYGNRVVENVINNSKCGLLCDFDIDSIKYGLSNLFEMSNDEDIRNSGKQYIQLNHCYSKMAHEVFNIIDVAYKKI